MLLLVRKEVTKVRLQVHSGSFADSARQETLVYGVGLRFAIANWVMAGWAVCFVSIIFDLALNRATDPVVDTTVFHRRGDPDPSQRHQRVCPSRTLSHLTSSLLVS